MENMMILIWLIAAAIPILTFVTIFIQIVHNAKNMGNRGERNSLSASHTNSNEETYKRRAKEFTEAAERGDAKAQFDLAEVYEFHESDKYIYWLEQAAMQGHKEAIRQLADAYRYGNKEAKPPIGVDLEKSLEYLTMLADIGDSEAMRDISLCYSVEFNDDDKAHEWTEKAANAGDIESMVELGDEYRLYSDVADFDKSEYWYKKAADKGDGCAMKGLGDLYCYDKLRHDYLKAEIWYKKAVEHNYWFAYVRLGDMYRDGKGFPKDDTMAFEYYKKAADKGDSYGKVNVAECYLSGRGVVCDEKEGVRILEEAAKDGYGSAEYLLGMCYFKGTGVEKNYKKAVEYFKKPKYDADATNMLGECYYFGYGVKEDKDKAHELWHQAAKRDCEDAINNLKTYFYETVEPCDSH